MERKIIQLSHDEDNSMVALADDGTIWVWLFARSAWMSYAAPLPQSETEPQE